jgi:Leucine-rich repeat (LRR) protein
VVLNEGLKSIGSRAFANSALEAVTLPSSVTFVGEKAFCYDQEMTAFNFNDAIPEISFRTFSETFNLKQMQIPDSVTSLDGLEDMTRLRSIYIPDSVTSFGTVGLSHYYTIEPVQYLIYTPEGSPAEQWAKEKRYFVIYADALPAASTASESPQTVLQTVPENGLVALDATFFPDPIFLSYVTQFDSDADGYLSVAECSAVTSVAVPAMNISSLYGIQYFKNLTFLDCHFNGLTALDISENKALKTLWCSYNALNTLNVAQNTALSTLWASRNQLQTIDLTHNPQLRSLSIGQNELTAIDLSALPVLAQLSCSNNHLSLLNTTANPELLWIDCFDNQLRALDVSQNPKLITLNAAYNQIVTMHTDNCPNLQNLNIGQNRDTLIAFDVSKNKALSYLHISDNYHLKEADLSNQTELSTLLCSALDESFKFTINQESPLFFMSDLETRTMTKVFTTKGMQKMAYEGDGVFVDIRCETGNYAYYHYEYRNAVPFDSTYELNMALEPIVTDEVLPAFSLNFYHYVDGDSTLSIAIDNARILLPDGTTIYLWDADRTFILPIEQNTWDNVRYAFGSQYFNFPYEMTSEQLQGGVFKADIKVNPQ